MDESLIPAESRCSSAEQFPFTSWLHLSLAWGRLSIFVPAVLAAGAPDEAAFMSDEAMESVPGLKPIQYTAKHYTLYLDKMVEKAKKLNRGNTGSTGGSICILIGFVNACKSLDHPVGPLITPFSWWVSKISFPSSSVDPQQDWTPHRLELCLWAMAAIEQQQLPLLKDVKAGSLLDRGSEADTGQTPAKKIKTK